MSPNPNDIAAAEGFGVPLTSIIAVGIIPAVVALIVTSLLAYHLRMRGTEIADSDVNTIDSKDLPPLWAALAGPFVTIAILVLRPIAGITIDPLDRAPGRRHRRHHCDGQDQGNGSLFHRRSREDERRGHAADRHGRARGHHLQLLAQGRYHLRH